MHNPKSVLENQTHKLLWDFKIEIDNLISARWPDLMRVNKKKPSRIEVLAVPADHWVKLKVGENKDKYLDRSRELKKNLENEGDSNTNFNWRARYSQQRVDKGIGGVRNKKTSEDHPNDSIIKNSQNTKKSPGDLRRLAVTHTPVRNYQLTLAWKTLKWVK